MSKDYGIVHYILHESYLFENDIRPCDLQDPSSEVMKGIMETIKDNEPHEQLEDDFTSSEIAEDIKGVSEENMPDIITRPFTCVKGPVAPGIIAVAPPSQRMYRTLIDEYAHTHVQYGKLIEVLNAFDYEGSFSDIQTLQYQEEIKQSLGESTADIMKRFRMYENLASRPRYVGVIYDSMEVAVEDIKSFYTNRNIFYWGDWLEGGEHYLLTNVMCRMYR